MNLLKTTTAVLSQSFSKTEKAIRLCVKNKMSIIKDGDHLYFFSNQTLCSIK